MNEAWNLKTRGGITSFEADALHSPLPYASSSALLFVDHHKAVECWCPGLGPKAKVIFSRTSFSDRISFNTESWLPLPVEAKHNKFTQPFYWLSQTQNVNKSIDGQSILEHGT